MIFMFLAGTNFIVHYFLIKGKFNKILENDEFWFYLFWILFSGVFVTIFLYLNSGLDFENSFRDAFFQVISIITCTGFATADYLAWPVMAWSVIFFAMFLGGCTGSTAGGIKMARHVVLIKNIRNILIQSRSPNAIVTLKLNKNLISPETNNTILTFITLYIFIFFAGTFLMSLMGIDIKTASSSVATCMAGIGPGIGTVGPVSNYAHLPDAAKILLPFLMIIGRLEIFTVMVLFSRDFWRK